jgi:hypothetical protein
MIYYKISDLKRICTRDIIIKLKINVSIYDCFTK